MNNIAVSAYISTRGEMMDDCELVALITAIACTISKCCSEDEISILAAGFTQLGDTLATLIAQREIREKKAAEKNTCGKASNGQNGEAQNAGCTDLCD
jgi:hypothetical protein